MGKICKTAPGKSVKPPVTAGDERGAGGEEGERLAEREKGEGGREDREGISRTRERERERE